MNAQVKRRRTMTPQEGMSAPFILSLLFHAVAIAIAIFGLPYISKPIPEMAPPIPIEIAEISDQTMTDKPAERAQVKPEEKKEPPKPEPERPKQAPKQTAAPPPPPEPAKDEAVLPDKTVVKPKLVEKPKEKPPTPPKKRPVTPVEAKAAPQEDPFQSLLKNLQEEKPDPSKEQGKEVAKPQQAAVAPLGEKMTLSEMDALRQQLSQCWNVLAGARYAEDLVVDMKLFMNPDRTVQQASVVDTARYNSDDIFRAAADSALRAIRDPQCSPLRLPPDKYEQWKQITVRFDPRDIL
jgi:outer membrane biosynthesis protein TonB